MRALRLTMGVLLLLGAGCANPDSPEQVQRAYARARMLASQGRPDDAVEILYRLLDAHPNHLEANRLFIELRSRTAQPVVLKEYEGKLKAAPDDSQLYFLAGCAAAKPATKLQYFRKATELEPEFYDAQFELGRLCRTKEVNDLAASRVALEMAASLRPRSFPAHAELGRTLAALGKTAEADAALRRALELDPSNEAAWFDLACLLSRDPAAEAEKTLADAVRRCPTSGRLWWRLADLHWAHRAYDAAATPLERALAFGPDEKYAPEARERLAVTYLLRGWHQRARRLGAEAWALAAEEMAAGVLPAEAFRIAYDAREAAPAARAEALHRAAKLAPKSSILQAELGEALCAAGSYGPAAAAYSRARARRPADQGLRLRYAAAELLAGRQGVALASLQLDRRRLSREAAWLIADAEAVASGDVSLDAVTARHAAGQARAARPAEHLRLLRACIAAFPAYLTPRLELAEALHDAGQEAEARAVLEAAATWKGPPLAEADLQMQLGDADLADKAFGKAADHYRTATERCPDLARAHGALAQACAENGDFGPAADALTRQLALDPQSYDLPSSGPKGRGAGYTLLPRLGPWDVLRYRYSTDGGQPGRRPAIVDFDLVVEAVNRGQVVEGRLEIVAVTGRPVEGGRDFVGVRIPFRCSCLFGLVAVEPPAGRVPREFAHLLWLVQFLFGPALPTPRWPGQAWRDVAWAERGAPYGGHVTFLRTHRATAHLSRAIRYERPLADVTTEMEFLEAGGQAAIAFDLTRRLCERVEITLNQTVRGRQGSRADLPAWMHKIELLKVERGARKAP